MMCRPLKASDDTARNARHRPIRGEMPMNRREQIIACTRELYEEKGLTKTSVQDIADKVGVARSLFYHYFTDKDDVTSAVLDS